MYFKCFKQIINVLKHRIFLADFTGNDLKFIVSGISCVRPY